MYLNMTIRCKCAIAVVHYNISPSWEQLEPIVYVVLSTGQEVIPVQPPQGNYLLRDLQSEWAIYRIARCVRIRQGWKVGVSNLKFHVILITIPLQDCCYYKVGRASIKGKFKLKIGVEF
jgi:hypothetical protein